MNEYMNAIKKISGEIWMIFKSHIPVKNDDEYWEEVLSQLAKVDEKYSNTEYSAYVHGMVILYHDELQRLWRKEFKKGEEN